MSSMTFVAQVAGRSAVFFAKTKNSEFLVGHAPNRF
jgi:hypothetical protein